MPTTDRPTRILGTVAGLLALVASAAGVFVPQLYTGLVPHSLLPGLLAQDVVTVGASIALLALSAIPGTRPKGDLVALGLVAYLAYAYGILVIEREYNELYLVYLAVFGLAVWTLVAATISMRRETLDRVTAARWVRNVAAAGALLQPLVFIPLWVVALLPLMAERRQIDALYSVYILDLCFVMPAFLLAAVLVWRRRGAGLVLASVMFVFGAVLIGSLAISALVGPVFGLPITVAGLLPSLLLTALFGALAILVLRRLELPDPLSAAVRQPAAAQHHGAHGTT